MTGMVLLLAVASARADWFDNFDSYTPGSINGQGGWKGWDNVPAAAGTVTGEQYRSPYQSQLIEGVHDSVHEYSGYTTGTWVYTAWQYIPSTMTGETYFIMLSKYQDGGASTYDRWTVQLDFNSANGKVWGDCGSPYEDGASTPYLTNQWVPIRVEIYLTEDWTKVYYNNVLLDDPTVPDHATLGGGYSWTKGIFGQYTEGSANLNIGAVDLFANGATKVYYDDMSLVPEPASCLLLLALGLLRRR
jgi:hypothetical protein